MLDVLMNNDITELLKETHVFLGKISASCSGIHQASDVSPLFRAAKQKVAYVTNHEVNVSNYTIERRIESVMASSTVSTIANISSEQKKKISYGCMVVLWSLRPLLVKLLDRPLLSENLKILANILCPLIALWIVVTPRLIKLKEMP